MDTKGVLVWAALIVAGFALQWARGFKWCGDRGTYVLAVLLAIAAWPSSWVVDHRWAIPDWSSPAWLEALVQWLMERVPDVVAGTFLGHTASQAPGRVRLAPKFNEFSR